MDQKRQLEDRKKAGLVTPGPASFDTLKKTLEEISEQLATVEKDYQQLARRIGGQR
jgi:tetrahydromethanopterin S-methyltransferase subunit G